MSSSLKVEAIIGNDTQEGKGGLPPILERAKGSTRRKKVFALSLGQGITSLVALAVSAILARMLSKTEYATFRQTFLAYQFVAPLLILGLPQAVYYFLPCEHKRIRGRVVDCLAILIILGLLFSVFLGLGGNRLLAWRFNNPALEHTLLYLFPYAVFMLPMSLLASVLVIQEKIPMLATFNVVSRLSIGLAAIAPVFVSRTATGSIIGQVGMTILMAGIALYIMFITLPKDLWRPSITSMIELCRYAVPLGLASMIGTITLQLDKVIVSAMRSPEDFAVFANGAIEIPLIGIITGSITVVLLSEMRRKIVSGNVEEALILFRLTAEKSSYFLFPVMLFLFICGDLVIEILFSAKYASSVAPFRIYLLNLPARTVVFGALMMALGQSKSILYRSIVELVFNLLLSIILVFYFGYIGAAIGTLLTIYIISVPYNIYTISRDINVPWTEILPIKSLKSNLIFLFLPTIGIVLLRPFIEKLVPIFQVLILFILYFSVICVWLNRRVLPLKNIFG